MQIVYFLFNDILTAEYATHRHALKQDNDNIL